MINNAFYFILKALCILRYLYFCPDFFGNVGKRLDKKANINFKTEIQRITINILPDISKSKGNQTIKFGQLIEYNVKNIFH